VWVRFKKDGKKKERMLYVESADFGFKGKKGSSKAWTHQDEKEACVESISAYFKEVDIAATLPPLLLLYACERGKPCVRACTLCTVVFSCGLLVVVCRSLQQWDRQLFSPLLGVVVGFCLKVNTPLSLCLLSITFFWAQPVRERDSMKVLFLRRLVLKIFLFLSE